MCRLCAHAAAWGALLITLACGRGGTGTTSPGKALPDGPHGAMLGHWREIRVGTDRSPHELYIGETIAWRVDSGEKPVRLLYRIVEQDVARFELRMALTGSNGAGETHSTTSFSQDRREMTNTVVSEHLLPNGQRATITLPVRYLRIDARTAP